MERHDVRPQAATRRALYALSALLWASGAALIVLQLCFRQAGEFGFVRHPAEPALHTLHGVLAVLGLFGLGWLVARHVDPAMALSAGRNGRNPREQRDGRRGGPLLLASIAVLASSGFALYYLPGDAARAASSWLHDVLGALVVVPALWHWLRRSRPTRD